MARLRLDEADAIVSVSMGALGQGCEAFLSPPICITRCSDRPSLCAGGEAKSTLSAGVASDGSKSKETGSARRSRKAQASTCICRIGQFEAAAATQIIDYEEGLFNREAPAGCRHRQVQGKRQRRNRVGARQESSSRSSTLHVTIYRLFL